MKLGLVLLGVLVGGSAACAPRYELNYPVGASGTTEPMHTSSEGEAAAVDEAAIFVDPESEDAEEAAEVAAAPTYDQRHQPVQGLAVPFQGRVRGNNASGGSNAAGRPAPASVDIPGRKSAAGAFTRDMPSREVPALPPPPAVDGSDDRGGDAGE